MSENRRYDAVDPHPATLMRSMERARKSLDLILPNEDSIIRFQRWDVFSRLSSLASKRDIVVRVVCVFSEATQRTIREFFPFIQFKPISLEWETYRIILIVDGSEILFFEPTGPTRRMGAADDGGRIAPQIMQEDGSDSDRGLQMTGAFDMSSKPMLVQAWIEVFKGLLRQREQFEALVSEKHYTEFLLDLLSHDIGNYHQIILLSLELAQMVSAQNGGTWEHPSSPEGGSAEDMNLKLSEILARARDTLERSVRLVNNVKLLGKLRGEGQASLEARDLLSTIEESGRTVNQEEVSTSTSINRKTLELNVIPGRGLDDPERPYVLADELLGEVFVNLFSNTLKYTDADVVRVDVSIERHEIGPTAFLEVSVLDYGHGIHDEVKDKVFDRFSNYAVGTGLGLSIVNALITRYQGKLWVEDRVSGAYSKGACFGMLLKRAPAPIDRRDPNRPI
jgi:signal transduction histidine kinase